MDLLDDENVGARTVSRPKETAIDRAGRPMYGSDGRKLSIPERNYAFRIQELEQELQALREAASRAKVLLDDATYHDGRYGQRIKK